MLKGLAIFIFILGIGFYLILFSQNQPEEKIIENNKVQFLTQKTAEEETPAFVENTVSEKENRYLSLDEIQEKLDDIAEQIDILAQEVKKLSSLRQVAGAETENIEGPLLEEVEEEIEGEELVEKKKTEENETEKDEEIPTIEPSSQRLCQIEPGISPERNKIIINELAWAGSAGSADSEWLELKNISGAEISLSGWQMVSGDGKIKIFFSQENFLPAATFYLLERTDDQTLPGLAADKIYTGALKNDGDNLYFFDENCQLQDYVLAFSGWPFGDNNSKRTMERRPDFDWQTSANAGGTPKAENSGGYYESFPGGGVVVLPKKPAYLKVLISEIQIAGKESKKDDFVELYNPNYEDIDLTGWYLQRRTETGNEFVTYVSSKQFAQKTIKSQSYFLAANASSSFSIFAQATTTNPLTGNNTLVLKNPNGDIVDKVGFGNAQDFETAAAENPEAGQSIGRRWSDTAENYTDTDNNQNDFEIQKPTPRAENQYLEPENQLPIAYFIFTPATSTIYQEILLDASSSTDPDGNIAQFIWDFGDNNATTTNQSTTAHTFATSGEFLITLFVADNLGATSSLATATINIIPPPQPILESLTTTLSFRGEEGENIASQIIIFTNAGEGDLNWEIYPTTTWLLINNANSATGTIAAASSSDVEFSVNIAGLGADYYTATATIEATEAQNSPKDISINLTIFPKTTKAVVINEIAWMGTATSSWDEWIELFNNTASDIDIGGWVLAATDGTPNITFSSSSIPAQSYLLLERTDDNTISDILADLIYTGALGNNGENLELRDASSTLIDLVDCSAGWFAGYASPDYVSMERIDSSLPGSYPDNWADNNGIIKNGLDAQGNPISGTPKFPNSVSQ